MIVSEFPFDIFDSRLSWLLESYRSGIGTGYVIAPTERLTRFIL